MESINKNWKSIFLFSTIFFILGYLVGNNLKGDEKKEHIVIKKFENGKGIIDFNRNHKNYKKMIKEAEGDPNMTIKIDSTLKDGKKEIRVEVRKEIHSDH